MKYTPLCPLDYELFCGELGLPSHQNHNIAEVLRETSLGGKVKLCRHKTETFRILETSNLEVAERRSGYALLSAHSGRTVSAYGDLRVSDLRRYKTSHVTTPKSENIVCQSPSPYRRSALVMRSSSPSALPNSALRFFSSTNAAGNLRISTSPTRTVLLKDFKRVDNGDDAFIKSIFDE